MFEDMWKLIIIIIVWDLNYIIDDNFRSEIGFIVNLNFIFEQEKLLMTNESAKK